MARSTVRSLELCMGEADKLLVIYSGVVCYKGFVDNVNHQYNKLTSHPKRPRIKLAQTLSKKPSMFVQRFTIKKCNLNGIFTIIPEQ